MLANLAVTLVGLLLIALGLRDVFQTLLDPAGRGHLSNQIVRTIWRAARTFALNRPAVLVLAGPSAMVAVFTAWTFSLAVGWALVIWPHLPSDFLLDAGLTPTTQNSFHDALYVSLVTLTTLGYGDITPRTGWLRLFLPLEGLVGFILLTAVISWVMSVYPVLARRGRLAHHVLLIRRAEAASGARISDLEPAALGGLLGDLADRLLAVRTDLGQFPVSYYFRGREGETSLAAALLEVARIIDELQRVPDPPPSLRLQVALLRAALDDLVAEIGTVFLNHPPAPLDQCLSAYAHDHLVKTGLS